MTAIPVPTPPMALDDAAVETWAKAHVDGFHGPVVATKFPTGQSNPTYLLETPAQKYVLRRKPPGKLLKSAHAVDREFRVLSALHKVGFPVPHPLALCEDDTVIGSAFYLMELVEGRIFWDPSLPDLPRENRHAIFDAMSEGLAALHKIDVAAVGLADYGKPGNYFARQVQRWSEQYRAAETSTIVDMNNLMTWLIEHLPADDGRVSLVHGDWRIDNMIFDKTQPKLAAVLDWELSTLGHPFADIAYQCMQWRMPSLEEDQPRVGVSLGLAGVDRKAIGIPTEAEYVANYCRSAGLAGIPDWDFLLAFSFFRYASIAQGVYKRALDGNASNPIRGRRLGEAVPLMAKLAMEIVEKGA
jgi:aminoglycoside phosphotransferase (APT) family kinase protein